MEPVLGWSLAFLFPTSDVNPLGSTTLDQFLDLSM